LTKDAEEKEDAVDDFSKLLMDMNELSIITQVKNDYEPRLKIRGRKVKESSKG
jgi:hypothetical protein